MTGINKKEEKGQNDTEYTKPSKDITKMTMEGTKRLGTGKSTENGRYKKKRTNEMQLRHV